MSATGAVAALAWAGVLFMAAALFAPRLWSGHRLRIEADTMHPAIKRGDLALITPVASFDEIAEGDLVAYATRDEIITHRVHRFHTHSPTGERLVVMKGDANERPDPLAVEEQLRGKVVRVVPKAGGAARWIGEHTPEFLAAAVAAGACALAADRLLAGR